jgi:hypothetical protein
MPDILQSPKKEVLTMRLMRKRRHRADWNHQRERDYERNRAMNVLRNSLLFLFLGFAVLAVAFARAWTM